MTTEKTARSDADLQRAVEALLFASGDPVSVVRMAAVLLEEKDAVEEAAKALADRYSFERRGMRIVRLDDSFQMVSSREFADEVALVLETRKPPRLSSSALETLTIIAYYQPATKAFVEQLRGVDCSYSISSLLNKELIEERGRLKVPGRPILYGTTLTFLRAFGLESLDDLPEVDLPEAKAIDVEEILAMEETEAENRETAQDGEKEP